MKISKFLAQGGIASRRRAEELVLGGHVKVNGKISKNVALRIDPKIDAVEFDGKSVKSQTLVYYLLNKPLGYTSSTDDPHAKDLITTLVPQNPPVWPVGRLDKMTSGLILLTNDGQLAQKIAHPSNQIQKEYEIATNLPLGTDEIKKIQSGLLLEDGFLKPDRFETLGDSRYRIIIHSGKKRVVRRMIEKIGKSVNALERTRIGFLTLGNLKSGEWRTLSKGEITKILR